jgi:hypothetical protein
LARLQTDRIRDVAEFVHPIASDGDTIRIGPGTFAGGITIDKSVNLVGAGAASTTISGGGPVLTIGTFLGSVEPTVTISGVTITGGLTGSSEQANLFFGIPKAIGGGVYIPPAVDFTPGATVTISDSAITHNRAAPTASFAPTAPAPSWPVCPTGLCPFAGASGGGIANDGNLTLIRTAVTDNEAVGPVASDSDGGGIWMGFSRGSLTMRNSTLSGNRASVSDPNGRFAEGGGLFTTFGDTVTITDSRVNENTASLTSTFPYFLGGGDTLEIATNSGAIHMGSGGTLTITNSEIDGNTVIGSDLNGTNADVFAERGFSAGGAFEFEPAAQRPPSRAAASSRPFLSPSRTAESSPTCRTTASA